MDTLNIIPLLDNRLKRTFEVFNPKKLFINNNNGKFNGNLNVSKDQVLGMASFNL